MYNIIDVYHQFIIFAIFILVSIFQQIIMGWTAIFQTGK